MEQILLDVLHEYGLAAALILFFSWRDWKREGEQNARYASLEQFQRETIMELVERVVAVVQTNTAAILRIDGLPCALKEKRAEEAREALRKAEGY